MRSSAVEKSSPDNRRSLTALIAVREIVMDFCTLRSAGGRDLRPAPCRIPPCLRSLKAHLYKGVRCPNNLAMSQARPFSVRCVVNQRAADADDVDCNAIEAWAFVPNEADDLALHVGIVGSNEVGGDTDRGDGHSLLPFVLITS